VGVVIAIVAPQFDYFRFFLAFSSLLDAKNSLLLRIVLQPPLDSLLQKGKWVAHFCSTGESERASATGEVAREEGEGGRLDSRKFLSSSIVDCLAESLSSS